MTYMLEDLPREVRICEYKINHSFTRTYTHTHTHSDTPELGHLKDGSTPRSWKSYFDHIIVDSKKPLFFAEGSMLREVDEETGSLIVGMFTGALQAGKVFSGGKSSFPPLSLLK